MRRYDSKKKTEYRRVFSMDLLIDQLQLPNMPWAWSSQLLGGQCVCLQGPSGCGKTRLLRALADLEPHTGRIHLNGQAATQVLPHVWRQRVGFLANPSAWWHDLVRDHFATPENLSLSDFGLHPRLLDQPVRHLSSGEKQRLALVRLLCQCPDVLLLDEPTSNLDAATAQQLETTMQQWLNPKRLLLWVSHSSTQVARLADRVFILHADEIREQTR